MLCNKKKLAKTSSRPGKTQLINHFLINKQWYLVDLPGYGYARTSKAQEKAFQEFITDYLIKRKELISTFLLIDLRHKPQPLDLKYMRWLGKNLIPFSIIFTKKLNKLKEVEISQSIFLNTLMILRKGLEEIPQLVLLHLLKKKLVK